MIRRLGLLPKYLAELRQRKHQPSYGHNPMGVLSVLAMLAALMIQLGTGLFSVDVDGLESGPLAILVSFDTGREFAEIHDLNFNILSTFIALHIVAILFYRFILGDNLIAPMISGRRARDDFSSPSLPETKVGIAALLIGIAAAVAGDTPSGTGNTAPA